MVDWKKYSLQKELTREASVSSTKTRLQKLQRQEAHSITENFGVSGITRRN